MTTGDPAEVALLADARSPRMQAATDDGLFGVHELRPPLLFAWVAVSGQRLGLRLECSGYPGVAPAGRPWDLVTDTALPVELWPAGGRSEMVFRRDWSVANQDAPYLACDRIALAGHNNWATEFPTRAWTSRKTVADYLEQVRDALRGSHLLAPAAQ